MAVIYIIHESFVAIFEKLKLYWLKNLVIFKEICIFYPRSGGKLWVNKERQQRHIYDHHKCFLWAHSSTNFDTFTLAKPAARCHKQVFAGIVMTSSSGINTAMHTIWSVLAQASSKIFPVYCVHRTVTNWNLETSQCPIKTCLILTKLCIFKKFWQTIFVYIT